MMWKCRLKVFSLYMDEFKENVESMRIFFELETSSLVRERRLSCEKRFIKMRKVLFLLSSWQESLWHVNMLWQTHDDDYDSTMLEEFLKQIKLFITFWGESSVAEGYDDNR